MFVHVQDMLDDIQDRVGWGMTALVRKKHYKVQNKLYHKWSFIYLKENWEVDIVYVTWFMETQHFNNLFTLFKMNSSIKNS